MIVDIKTELYTCLFTFVFGIISAFVYDFFRAIKLREKRKSIFYVIQSIYFILTGILCFLVIRNSNDGNFRLYQVICFLTGFLIYRSLIGSRMLKITNKIFDLFEKLFILLIKIVFYPFKFLVKLLNLLIFKKISLFFHKIFKNTLTRGKKCFKIRVNVSILKQMFKIK